MAEALVVLRQRGQVLALLPFLYRGSPIVTDYDDIKLITILITMHNSYKIN